MKLQYHGVATVERPVGTEISERGIASRRSGQPTGIEGSITVNRTVTCLAVAVTAVIAGANALAQEPPDLQELAARMKQNQEDLRSYSWQTKIVFSVDGKQKRADVYNVRYSADGFLQKTQINSQVDPTKIRRPDGKKLSKDEREAARAFAMEAKRQVDAYLSPLFAEKAVATATVVENGTTLRLRSRNVVAAGDSVEIAFERATMMPIALDVTTTVSFSPVALDVSFGAIEYGPRHPARSTTTTEWQGFKLTITTENSSYSKQDD
jgi:hypothetical protein